MTNEECIKYFGAPAISLLIGIITVVVSIVVTKLNIKASQENLEKQLVFQRQTLEMQMRMQIATTLEKEWVANVRASLGRIGKLVDEFVELNEDQKHKELSLGSHNKAIALHTKSINENFCLLTYLNPQKVLEKNLLDAIEMLIKAVDPDDGILHYHMIEDLQNKLLEAAHQLFDSRIPAIE